MRRALGILLLLVSCSAAPRETTGTARSAIIGGSASGYDEDAVVALMIYYAGAPFALCTATLVAPNLLVTARHCTTYSNTSSECRADGTPIDGAKLGPDVPPALLLVYRGQTLGDAQYDPNAAEARGIAIVQEDSTVTCNTDVSFVVLDRDLPGRFAPLRTKPITAVGEPLTAVGYGVRDDGQLSPDRLHRENVPVTHVGPIELDPLTHRGLGESEISVGESVCSGDSGGPLLSASGAVVGVAGRGGSGADNGANDASSCTGATASNVFTTVANKPALVAEAFARAGHELRSENDRSKLADGAACEQSFDCTSDACVHSACASRCETIDCENGLACAPFEDKQVCEDPSLLPTRASGSGCAMSHHSGNEPEWLGALALVLFFMGRHRRTDEC